MEFVASLEDASDIEFLIDGELLVARRALNVQIKEDEKVQREINVQIEEDEKAQHENILDTT